MSLNITEHIEAKIYLGLKEGYEGYQHTYEELLSELERWSSLNVRTLSITRTNFIYPTGKETGVTITLINYARFPMNFEEIKNLSINLADELVKKFGQYRATVTFCGPFKEHNIMITNDEKNE